MPYTGTIGAVIKEAGIEENTLFIFYGAWFAFALQAAYQ